MKRITLTLMIGVFAYSLGIHNPQPEPIEDKPVLVSEAKQWDLTKVYYQKVTMPNGYKVELKSKTPLTKEQWQAKADDLWEIQQQLEADKPKVCPYCGQPLSKEML